MSELTRFVTTYTPRALEAIVILAVGFVLAVVVRRVSVVLLQRYEFDLRCDRVGIGVLMRQSNIGRTPTQFVAAVLFWVMLALALLAALGPTVLNNTIGTMILYAPRLFVGILIVVLGTAAAGLAAQLTEGGLSSLGVRRVSAVASIVRYGIIFLAIILAAAMAGIDTTILVVVTMIALGGASLTAALALGLGLRRLSENIAASRYIGEGIAEGDTISVGGLTGTVARIGHAVTTIRGEDGRSYLVPNSYFLENVVEKLER